jgi:DNA processing protein
VEAFADNFGSIQDEEDAFLNFCQNGVSYEEALAFDSAKLFEYELLGKIIVEQGKIRVP